MIAYLFAVLGFAGLLGCYDIARRMNIRTRHGMRLAVIVIGVGCMLAMVNEHDAALAVLLVGCGLYRLFDKRAGVWHDGTDMRTGGAVVSEPGQQAKFGPDIVAARHDALGGGLHLATVRQDPVRRSA